MTQDSTQLPGPDDPVPVLSYQAPRARGSNAVVWKITGIYLAWGIVAVIVESLGAAPIITERLNPGGDYVLVFFICAILGLIGWAGSSIILWLCCRGHCRGFFLENTRRWTVKGALPAAFGFILGWEGLMTVPMWNANRGLSMTAVAVWLVAVFGYLLAGPIVIGDWLWSAAVRENGWRSGRGGN